MLTTIRMTVLLCGWLTATVAGASTYPAFTVSLRGIPTLALVKDRPASADRQASLEQPLFSFEYFYTVRTWKWGGRISQSGARRKPWSVKPPLLTIRGQTLSYLAEVGTFPCTMEITRTQPTATAISWRHDLRLGGRDYPERRELREAGRRGLLLKFADPDSLEGLTLGNPGDSLLAAFGFKGENYRLELTGSTPLVDLQPVQAPAGQLWLACSLALDPSELVRFSVVLDHPAKLPVHPDYSWTARRHNQDGWLTCNLQDDSYWLDIGKILLDPPAGKYGFLTVRDGRFVFAANNRPFFMSGTTFVHNSKFPDKQTARKLARRVAAMGFNLVRLHHLDYHIPGFGLFDRQAMRQGRTGNFDPELLDRMDYFIAQLKAEGVYIHLDGISARRFLQNDGVPGSQNLSNGLKGSAYIMAAEVLREKQEQFFTTLWDHVNPYTGLAYKDEPAIVTTTLLNENDLYTHGSFRHHIPEPYRSIYLAGERKWQQKNSASYPADTYDQALLYKRDLMRDYFQTFGALLKEKNPLRPFSGTNWIDSGSRLRLLNTYRQTDFTADHPYRSGPLAPETLNPIPASAEKFPALTLAKLWNKPVMHEEWTGTGPDRAALLALSMALMTAQDHDATINFAMHHEYPAKKPGTHSTSFNMAHDPARSAILPALNLMFIRRDLKKNPRRLVYLLDEKILFGRGPDSLTAKKDISTIYPSYKAASFQGRTSFIMARDDLPALRQRFPNAEVVTPGQAPARLPDIDAYPLVNGGNEIRLYWKDRYFLVTAGRTKMAIGYFGGKGELDLGDGVRVNISSPGYACLIISSLTNKPIAAGPSLMLTVFGRAEARGTLYDSNWKDQVVPDTDLLIQPIRGTIILGSGAGKRQGYWFDQSGRPVSRLQTTREDGKNLLRLDGKGIVAKIEKAAK